MLPLLCWRTHHGALDFIAWGQHGKSTTKDVSIILLTPTPIIVLDERHPFIVLVLFHVFIRILRRGANNTDALTSQVLYLDGTREKTRNAQRI